MADIDTKKENLKAKLHLDLTSLVLAHFALKIVHFVIELESDPGNRSKSLGISANKGKRFIEFHYSKNRNQT